jgi:hypothetical protein
MIERVTFDLPDGPAFGAISLGAPLALRTGHDGAIQRPHRLPPRPAFDYSIHFVKEDSDA